ncbi:MAG: hypothetical protein M3N19_11750, partial [Candidatus Eremiobacteraeota bacterium]|nr:hypothetical protein [Candidatus Eremiobacteraeota bacterium]
MTTSRAFLLLAILLSVLGSSARAASPTYSLPITRVSQPPALDGDISDVWRLAPKVSITWNVDFHRPAYNLTEAYVLSDATFLYVLFVAHQHEPLTTTQVTDGSGVDNDDHVGLYVWPSGALGFRYFFEANLTGARAQESTENQSFSPDWSAHGRKTADGYTIAVRIPLNSMRGDGRSTWRLQLDRYVSASQEQNVWASAPTQRDEGEPLYAGYLTHMDFAGATARAKPRVGLYQLARIGSQNAGGNLLTAGADFAVPVTNRASVVGTLHPDYSSVELDQQTITPTAFKRFYQEVRPFFTQGANFYNVFGSGQRHAAATTMLYTPNIPTPLGGLALEGYERNVGFGLFDAVSKGRNDNAQSLSIKNESQTLTASLQRVHASYAGTTDTTTGASLKFDNQRTGFIYANVAHDSGSNVLDSARSNWLELGAGYRKPGTALTVSLLKIGAYYQPVDGYVQNSDIAGYALSFNRSLTFPKSSPLLAASLDVKHDLYHATGGRIGQGDSTAQFSLTTRTLFSGTIQTGSSTLLVGNSLLPFNQNGVTLGYLDGTSTPTDVGYFVGRFGSGYLHSLFSSTAFEVARRGSVNFEADETMYRGGDGVLRTQWLERVGVGLQIDKTSSL